MRLILKRKYKLNTLDVTDTQSQKVNMDAWN